MLIDLTSVHDEDEKVYVNMANVTHFSRSMCGHATWIYFNEKFDHDGKVLTVRESPELIYRLWRDGL